MASVCQVIRQGWVIILSVTMQLAFPSQIMLNNKILFEGKYQDVKSEQVINNSIFIVSMNLVTVLVGPMVSVTSARFVASLATSLVVFGLLLAAFADPGSGILVTIGYGVFIGAGAGISTVNNILFVKKHFSDTISLVFGIALTGICFVGIAVPYLLRGLKIYFGSDPLMKWPLMVYLAFSCVGFIAAFFMTASGQNEEHNTGTNELDGEDEAMETFLEEESEPKNINGDCGQSPDSLANTNEDVPLDNTIVVDKVDKPSENRSQICSYTCSHIYRMLKLLVADWALLKDPVFIVTAIVNSSAFSMSLFFITQLDFISSQVTENNLELNTTIKVSPNISDNIGDDDELRSPVMTILTLSEAAATLPVAIIGDAMSRLDWIRLPKKVLYMICCLGMSIIMFTSTLATSTTTFYIITITAAICKAGIQINTNLVYFDCFPRMFASAVGLSNLFRCIITFSFMYIFRWLLSEYGSYTYPTYFLASSICLGMTVWILLATLGCRQTENVNPEDD